MKKNKKSRWTKKSSIYRHLEREAKKRLRSG